MENAQSHNKAHHSATHLVQANYSVENILSTRVVRDIAINFAKRTLKMFELGGHTLHERVILYGYSALMKDDSILFENGEMAAMLCLWTG